MEVKIDVEVVSPASIDISKNVVNLDDLRERRDELLVFSFRFFNRNHEMFNLGGIEKEYFLSLLDYLRDANKLTWKSLYHQQIIDFGKNCHRYSRGAKYLFDIDDQYKDDCYQLYMDPYKLRIHGFLIGNVYYIVYLDPEHNMYPMDMDYPNGKPFSKPFSIWEKMEADKEELKRIIQAQNNIIKELRESNKLMQEDCLKLVDDMCTSCNKVS